MRVLTAEQGEQALETLRRQSVDVVTLDLKMPGLGGPKTLAQIRELDPDLEVVVVTGYGSYESAIEMLRLRAADYITKPFDAGRVLDVVRRAAERRQAKRGGLANDVLRSLLDELREETAALEMLLGPALPDPERTSLERIRLLAGALRDLVPDNPVRPRDLEGGA
ncbi:MAG: hypothetical protein QOD06_3126 [Candidatus Binatota bacterium]|nr:hypothetical protein [Candidatus Binatota bacterium]